jgi:hypothetical protein
MTHECQKCLKVVLNSFVAQTDVIKKYVLPCWQQCVELGQFLTRVKVEATVDSAETYRKKFCDSTFECPSTNISCLTQRYLYD